LVRQQYRAAFWVLVLIALVTSSLAAIAGAQASSANYTLTGYVEQGIGQSLSPVPAGVKVDLISQATEQVFPATTIAGGSYTFTSTSTSGALTPGYWGVYVPPQGNASIPSCNSARPFYQCAVLPTYQNTTFHFENASALTTTNYPFPAITGVTVLAYNGSLNGTVMAGGSPAPGAQVSLLAPEYNGLALVNNTTASNGGFHLNVPYGTWVLKTTLPGSSVRYNLTQVTIAGRTTVVVNPNVQGYIVSGYSNLKSNPSAHVPTAGNVTLWDPENGYIYSSATPPGGFYTAGTYPLNFKSGTQTFDVVLSSIGYSTVWYPLTVSSPTPYQQNVLVSPLSAGQYGRYQTVLDFSALNVSTGTGSLWVNSSAMLGNDSVFPNLPNATVGQLWSQLGLDYDRSLNFASASLPTLLNFVNQSGPLFPAVQAGTTVNGTGFLGPSGPQTLKSWSNGCTSTFCGPSSTASLALNWSQSYALNGTIPAAKSAYSIAFGFAHPSSSSDVFNYTVKLPAGYVLAAGTQAPLATKLAAAGTGGTWNAFTLSSLASATPAGSAKFSIVKSAALTAIVNVTVASFGFSAKNVLNSTQNNYTVEVGLGQNVTFKATNTLYPSGTNGTNFAWNFGDHVYTNTSSPTTNHTYSAVSGSTAYAGSVTVTSSGGQFSTTKFFVWVSNGPVVAQIAWNATTTQNKTAGSTTYVFVNWGTVLHFNATHSTAAVSPTAPVPGVLAVASYTLVSSHGFKVLANYSVAQNASFGSNFTYQFLGAGSYLSSGTVAGTAVPFLGWQYNLSLSVWSGTGQLGVANLVILVNDTEKPTAAIQFLTSAGVPVTSNSIVAGTNLSTRVQLNAANATDPHNGSIVKYYWLVTNSGNTSIHRGFNVTAVKPYPALWLAAATTAYKVNLTVWDRNGNSNYLVQTLTVSQNTATSPIMAASNLTGSTSLTDGTSYTYWVNITVGGGSKSVADNVSVAFYLLSPSGSGSRTYIGGSPAQVKFYNYVSGVVNTTSFATGLIPTLAFNTTVRAVITWTPSVTGNFNLYANVTASNEFAGNYVNGPNVAKPLAISVGPNPTTQLLEYVAIAVAVVVVLALLILYYRRRTRGGEAKGGTSRSGLERSKRSADDEDDDDDK